MNLKKKYYIDYFQFGGTYSNNLIPILFKNPNLPGYWEDGGLEVTAKVLEPRSELYKILSYTTKELEKYLLTKNKYAVFDTKEPNIEFNKSDVTQVSYGPIFINLNQEYLNNYLDVIDGQKIVLYIPDPNKQNFIRNQNLYITIVNRIEGYFRNRFYDDIFKIISNLILVKYLKI